MSVFPNSSFHRVKRKEPDVNDVLVQAGLVKEKHFKKPPTTPGTKSKPGSAAKPGTAGRTQSQSTRPASTRTNIQDKHDTLVASDPNKTEDAKTVPPAVPAEQQTQSSAPPTSSPREASTIPVVEPLPAQPEQQPVQRPVEPPEEQEVSKSPGKLEISQSPTKPNADLQPPDTPVVTYHDEDEPPSEFSDAGSLPPTRIPTKYHVIKKSPILPTGPNQNGDASQVFFKGFPITLTCIDC